MNADELKTLGGQISRFLESYKDNACLDYVSGVLRLSADQFDDTDGERRMASSLDQLLNQGRTNVLSLVRETLRLKELFSEDARSRYARLVHQKLNDVAFLQEINAELKDAYSYHTLLSPLVQRLEKLASNRKEIQW